VRRLFPFLSCAAFVGSIAGASRDAVADDPPCDAWEVEYTLAGTCAVRDTAMGAANGDWAVGPGTATVRFDNATGPAAGPAKLLSFSIKELFTSVVLGTKFTTDVTSSAAPTTTCSAAEGTVAGTKLTWDTKVRAFKIDGSLTCQGAMCGKFGGPPSGKSDYHMPAHDVDFAAWEYGSDMKTFTMAASLVSRGDSPKQSTYLTIAGRETKRTCVRAKPCK
jgi:hypothetical protein